MNTLTTDKLENELSEISNINDYIEKNSDEFVSIKLSDYLNELLGTHDTALSDVVKQCGLNRVYAYQLFEGQKTNPSRDKIIGIALGMKLDFAETQKLLKVAGMRPLYARDKRDSVITFAVKKEYNIIDTNILLEEQGFKIIE